MSLILRGNTWHVDLMIDGQRVRQSTDTGDKKLAESIHAKIYSSIIEGKYYPKPPGENKLFCEMMEKFAKEHKQYRGRKISQNTKTGYAYALKHLLPVFADMPLNKITPETIRKYQEDRENEGANPSTINIERALLSIAFNTAIRKWRWINYNPCKDVERLPEDNKRVRYLSKDEVEKIYQHFPEWLKPIITVARFTGLRIGNILSLTWQDVNLFSKTIVVGKTKNGEPIGLPINQTAFDTFKKLKKVQHISNLVFPNKRGLTRCKNSVSTEFKRHCNRAGIKNLRFHDLRHDFGSNLVQRGVDIYTVSKLMGHKDISMTQRYSHLSPEKLRKDIAVLDTPMTQNSHNDSKQSNHES